MSATHNSFGLNALKCLVTRSAGHCSLGADRVVLGDLARRMPCSPMARINLSTVQRATCPRPCRTQASGRVSIACILRAPSTQFLLMHPPDLGLEGVIASTPG